MDEGNPDLPVEIIHVGKMERQADAGRVDIAIEDLDGSLRQGDETSASGDVPDGMAQAAAKDIAAQGAEREHMGAAVQYGGEQAKLWVGSQGCCGVAGKEKWHKILLFGWGQSGIRFLELPAYAFEVGGDSLIIMLLQ